MSRRGEQKMKDKYIFHFSSLYLVPCQIVSLSSLSLLSLSLTINHEDHVYVLLLSCG